MSEISDKWDRRYSSAPDTVPEAVSVLQDNYHLLPTKGKALDIACGLGGNAIFLARTGLSVQAWDCSPVAIRKLSKQAKLEKLAIQPEVCDVLARPLKPDSFDVIVVSYFLERSLAKPICAALRPNGLLFYQTFTHDKVSDTGPTNPDFLLAENELLELFSELRLRLYREEGRVGNTRKGLRNEAILVGQKASVRKLRDKNSRAESW